MNYFRDWRCFLRDRRLDLLPCFRRVTCSPTALTSTSPMKCLASILQTGAFLPSELLSGLGLRRDVPVGADGDQEGMK